jgi:hypothetical protein
LGLYLVYRRQQCHLVDKSAGLVQRKRFSAAHARSREAHQDRWYRRGFSTSVGIVPGISSATVSPSKEGGVVHLKSAGLYSGNVFRSSRSRKAHQDRWYRQFQLRGSCSSRRRSTAFARFLCIGWVCNWYTVGNQNVPSAPEIKDSSESRFRQDPQLRQVCAQHQSR